MAKLKRNSPSLRASGNKRMTCKKCGEWVSVAQDCKSVECSRCVAKMVPWDEDTAPAEKIGPRGWHLRKVFVHEDGRVFHKGVEQPKLKGTLPPTKIEVKKKTVKEKRKKIREKDKEILEAMKTVDKRGRRPKKKR